MMEIVIRISKEDFEIMKHNIEVDNPLCPLNEKDMVATIANGTPLPKGHGRLIDADKMLDEMKATRTYDILFALERVKPIIEADKDGNAE
jgi:hypothetical protein